MDEIVILYESEGLIAINKPAGLLSIPGNDRSFESALTLLEARLGAKVYTVHRLDRDASGALVFARDPAAHRQMNDQFSRRAVAKEYLALVFGRVAAEEGEIDRPIRRFGSGRMGVDPARGKPSLTRYQVDRRGAAYSLLQVRPTTGRRHQIRVHLYSLGHPLVGDRLYGDRSLQEKFPRLMLHAALLKFIDPATKGEIAITAPVPPSFQEICDQLI